MESLMKYSVRKINGDKISGGFQLFFLKNSSTICSFD